MTTIPQLMQPIIRNGGIRKTVQWLINRVGMIFNAKIMKTFALQAWSIAISLLLISCEQDETIPIQSQLQTSVSYLDEQVIIENNIVFFTNTTFYENLIGNENGENPQLKILIDLLNGNTDYVSLRDKYELQADESIGVGPYTELEMVGTNDILPVILNEDGIVAIQDYYFKVDLNKEMVMVLPMAHAFEIDDLKSENMTNPHLMAFSTEEDVLDLLSEGSYGTLNTRTLGLFCNDSGADRHTDKGHDHTFSDLTRFYRTDNKVVYQKAGIYFSLQAKTTAQQRNNTGVVWWRYGFDKNMKIDYNVMYDKKCSKKKYSSGIKSENTKELSKRPYQSIRGLHRYDYRAKFYWGGFIHSNKWTREYRIKDL